MISTAQQVEESIKLQLTDLMVLWLFYIYRHVSLSAKLGADFKLFFENFRRRSVRVLKLHRGFILTKKGDINPQKNFETPPGPLGGRF